MQNINGFDFFALNFDENGKLTSTAEFENLKKRAAKATDAIWLAHGFRNDVNDATTLYTNFLKTFRSHFARPECRSFGSCDFVVAGVFWPSKPLPESFPTTEGSTQSADQDEAAMAALRSKIAALKEFAPDSAAKLDQAIQLLPQVKDDDGDAQNRFTDLVLSVAKPGQPDPTEGFEKLLNEDGTVILQKLSLPVILSSEAADSDSGGAMSIDDGETSSVASTFGNILGGVDKFINLTTWYIMKNRCGVVGATGVAQAVRDLKASNGNLRLHLVGHSLGGRLMAACAKALAQDPMLQPESVTLLEAAFSHYGFSDNNGKGVPGFFRDVMANKVVKGPLVATFSAQDTVVGYTYSLASRLAGDNVKAIGDANDPFGGIGRNGAQKTTESAISKLLKVSAGGGPYHFQTGIVNCLDGSGGLIKDHGDVTNEDVTYAFACAVAATQAAAASGAAAASEGT